ncbi:YcnI family protein [Jatrophihabitans endophyticus]|uniref:YcnI family protein n=1 Tax=Jatrophihabitans endophyticus TaxID=1206085 RepID=UPI001F46DB6F|nr:YcnI family protein [Jatrophihabitans endophyticus]
MSASLVLAAPASAHVSVSSTNAVQGGYAVVTFRMPNEEAKATTTKLQVQLPTATPFASASVQPVPGWTAVATKTKLAKPITTDDGPVTEAVTQITWTAATAAAVKPGEFQLFNVLVGPLPEQSTVTFKALQTYSNGDVVRWVETAAPGSSAEPEHPAPVLTLAPAGQSSSQPTSQPTSGASATVASAAAASDDGGSSNTGPIVLSIVALVLAAGAIGLGVVNRARRHG